MIAFKHFSAKALDFIKNSNARLNIAHGAVRSSKTVNCTIRWLSYIVEGPPGDLFMIGKTTATLQRNVVNDLRDIVGEANFKWVNKIQGECSIFGRRIYCIGASNAEAETKIRGATIAGAYCDEANLYPEDFFDQLMARMSVEGAKCFCNCNPDSPYHWFYVRYITNDKIENKKIWHFNMNDNLSLSEEYKTDLAQKFSGVFYRRFILGEWCMAEGLIYQQFCNSEQEYMIDQSEVPTLEAIYIGEDFGGNKSNHAYCASGIGYDGVLYVLGSLSITATGTSVEVITRNLISFCRGIEQAYGPIDTIYADCNEQAIINTQRSQVPWIIKNSIKNEIVDRIRCEDVMFGSHKIKIVRQSNEALIKFFRSAVWDKDAKKDKRLDNGTYSVDVGDAFEYSFEVRIREFLEA